MLYSFYTWMMIRELCIAALPQFCLIPKVEQALQPSDRLFFGKIPSCLR